MKKWIFVNTLSIVFIFGWSFSKGYSSSYIFFAKLLSQTAFLLFLININMYFILLLIRKGKDRSVKVALAKISKQMMKFHIPIAVTATILIVIHGTMMLLNQQVINGKIYSGLFSFFALLILLFSGVWRKLKASGARRKFHYRTAFLFFCFMLTHIFL